MTNVIASSTIPLFLPAILSVRDSIVSLTLSKSVNLLSGSSPNVAHGTVRGSAS